MTKKFRELAAPVLADPAARAEIDAYKRAMADILALAELREERGLTQTAVAQRLGTSQPNISAIERREDVYLSTLISYVSALGGRIEVRAIFPDADVLLFASGTLSPGQQGLVQAAGDRREGPRFRRTTRRIAVRRPRIRAR